MTTEATETRSRDTIREAIRRTIHLFGSHGGNPSATATTAYREEVAALWAEFETAVLGEGASEELAATVHGNTIRAAERRGAAEAREELEARLPEAIRAARSSHARAEGQDEGEGQADDAARALLSKLGLEWPTAALEEEGAGDDA